MSDHLRFPTKKAGLAYVEGLGYTIKSCPDGESGDHGAGSRAYRHRADSTFNQFGWPMDHAEVSRVGPVWCVSIFGLPEEDEA